MKVKQLIEQLKKSDPEATIYMSTDEEGNGFHGVEEVATMDGYTGAKKNGKTHLLIWPDNEYHDF